LVEHDTNLVLRVSGAVHVLDFGQVIATGTPDEIRRDPAVQKAYLGHAPERGGAGAGGEAPST
jgi:ABC-type branched-subunit amino acid transport system ATPase component